MTTNPQFYRGLISLAFQAPSILGFHKKIRLFVLLRESLLVQNRLLSHSHLKSAWRFQVWGHGVWFLVCVSDWLRWRLELRRIWHLLLKMFYFIRNACITHLQIRIRLQNKLGIRSERQTPFQPKMDGRKLSRCLFPVLHFRLVLTRLECLSLDILWQRVFGWVRILPGILYQKFLSQ